MRVSELLNKIPDSTKNRVQSIYEENIRLVRDALRDDIRLKLASKANSSNNEIDFRSRVEISVNEEGMPREVFLPDIPGEYELAAQLQYWLPDLVKLSKSSERITSMYNDSVLHELLGKYIDVKAGELSISETHSHTVKVIELAKLDEFNLVRHILSVNEDVMGCFRYFPSKDPYDEFIQPDKPFSCSGVCTYKTEINLYWGVIGLVSTAQNISLKGLVIKVLAHELAHAYTYLGFDRGGNRWTGRGFNSSDHELKEGLAQYYTWRVLERLKKKIPEGIQAYEEILPLQPKAYRSHQEWIDNAKPEAVATALTILRTQDYISYDEFTEKVKEINQQMGYR